MKWIKSYNYFISEGNLAPVAQNGSTQSFWEIDWNTIVPDEIVVIKGGLTDMNGYILNEKDEATDELMRFKKGNLMSDPVYQISYEKQFDAQGIPDTLEIDVSILDKSNVFSMNIEITFGNLVAVGFNIQPKRKVDVYQFTSYHSKMDPTNTVFAFDESSLIKLKDFINRFDGIQIERADLNFLDKEDNYTLKG